MNKIDVRIAEKVMGWKLMNGEEYRPAKSKEDYRVAMRDDGWYWEGYGAIGEAWDWRPSKDIGKAWQVVEKLREKSLAVSVEQVYVGTTEEWSYSVCIYRYGDDALEDNLACMKLGKDLPKTICEAALRAVK